MRVFQNSGVYKAYAARLKALTDDTQTFAQQMAVFLHDRYGASHLLQPVLAGDSTAFFTNSDNDRAQRAWAREKSLSERSDADEILLTQIEEHRTEVFYNMDPVRYQSDFIRRLPGCVKVAIAWRAAPSGKVNFSAYDRIVCNFPSILAEYERIGWKTGYLSPAHDPEMDPFAANRHRPIDILFVGGYSRHHKKRADMLEAVAHLSDTVSVVYALDRSRLTRLAEDRLAWLPGLVRHRRPPSIRRVSRAPAFGRELYALLSQAKIVLNGAVDMAGHDRGNMRCFEAMGCACLMASDRGNYPDGMVDGESIFLYSNPSNAPREIMSILKRPEVAESIARAGHSVVTDIYGKERQWAAFQNIVSQV